MEHNPQPQDPGPGKSKFEVASDMAVRTVKGILEIPLHILTLLGKLWKARLGNNPARNAYVGVLAVYVGFVVCLILIAGFYFWLNETLDTFWIWLATATESTSTLLVSSGILLLVFVVVPLCFGVFVYLSNNPPLDYATLAWRGSLILLYIVLAPLTFWLIVYALKWGIGKLR